MIFYSDLGVLALSDCFGRLVPDWWAGMAGHHSFCAREWDRADQHHGLAWTVSVFERGCFLARLLRCYLKGSNFNSNPFPVGTFIEGFWIFGCTQYSKHHLRFPSPEVSCRILMISVDDVWPWSWTTQPHFRYNGGIPWNQCPWWTGLHWKPGSFESRNWNRSLMQSSDLYLS